MEGGRTIIGQISCSGDFVLNHVDDDTSPALRVFEDPEEAANLARFDDAGEFRPLKTAPNLRHGWQLRLKSLSDVRLALDLFYPAVVANALALERGEPIASDLRDCLGRQTGMYAVTKKITDEEATEIIRDTCDQQTKCRNHILWNISPGLPTPRTIPPSQALQDPIPLLCTEACPLLVAEARRIVKARK